MVGNEANADRKNQERDLAGLEMKLARAKTYLRVWESRVDHLLEYFICEGCEQEMHDAYKNRFSWVELFTR